MIPLPFNPFSAVTSKVYAGVAVAAALAAGLQTCRLDREQTAHVQTKERTVAAQQVARVRQDAADLAIFILGGRIAHDASIVSELARRETRAAVDRYAAAHPVRLCRQAPERAPGGPGPAGVPGDPGPAPEPPADSGLVALARADLDDLAQGAVQGAAKTLFLKSLVDAGLAIPLSQVEPGFAP